MSNSENPGGEDSIFGDAYKYTLKPEDPIDRITAVFSILYLLLAMVFFIWQLFDIWVGRYTVAKWIGYPNILPLNNASFHLAIYAFLGGALGGTIYGIRKFMVWHSERLAFGQQFIWFYLTAPWIGAILGFLTYLLIQTGIAVIGSNSAAGTISTSRSITTICIGLLAGFGSQQVFIWLDAQVVKTFPVSKSNSSPTEPTQILTSKVPTLKGKAKDDAKEALKKAGLVLGEIKGDLTDANKIGTVTDQYPPEESIVKKGSRVRITIGVPPKVITSGKHSNVPLLIRLLIKYANAVIQKMKADLSEIREEEQIVLLVPSPASTIPSAPTVTVPQLEYMSKGEAETKLQEVGLVLGEIVYKDTQDPKQSDKVIEQDPESGKLFDPGAPVKIIIGQLTKAPM